MPHRHRRIVMALRSKQTMRQLLLLFWSSVSPSTVEKSVRAVATNNGPGDPHGHRYNNDTPSLPPRGTRAATNTTPQTLIWSGMTRVLIRCRRCVGKHDGFSSTVGWRDAVEPGMVPPHDQVSS